MLFVESNLNSSDGTPLELFTETPWDQYLESMPRNGTYGDHITLPAIANLFNVRFVLYSTHCTLAMQTITPVGCLFTTFYVGHFAGGAGEHYVCLADDNHELTAADESASGNVPCSLPDEPEADKAEDSYSN